MRLTRYIAAIVLCFAAINVTAQTINIATYNIRYENKSDSLNGNGWGQRLPVIAKLIQFHDFDIFGAQEFSTDNLTVCCPLCRNMDSLESGAQTERNPESARLFSTKKRSLN